MTAVREVRIGPHVLYLGRCEDVLPDLGRFDACVTDPPYGIAEAAGKNATRSNLAVARDYGNHDWDNAPITDIVLAECLRSARWHIIFGGNYYRLPPSSCWLVWDKENTGDFADCELAWTNLPKATRLIRFMWNGMLRRNNEPRGDHPTQKPVGVMRWALSQLPDTCAMVVDPFAGSGTTGVAAVQRGLRFTGIEQYPPYFDIMCRRVEAAARQADLFHGDHAPAPVRAVQPDMLAALAPAPASAA